MPSSVPKQRLLSKEIPYQDWSQTLQLFSAFSYEPWALLLDSANSPHVDSRYDVLLRRPSDTLVGSVESFTQSGLDPFEHLQTLLAAMPRYEGEHTLPFKGGAAGYIAYDAGRLLETITPAKRAATENATPITTAKHDINLPDLALGIYQHALIIDHKEKRSYILAPAAELDAFQAFWQPTLTQPFANPFSLRSPWRSNLNKEQYHLKIAQIHAHLRAGDCYQINLAQRFSAAYQGDEWQAYIALRQANQAPFSAFMRLDQGVVLSLSPERFLKTDHTGHVQTKPIKGTRPRFSDAKLDNASKEELVNSAKDQAENLMITDLLRNDLSRKCIPGSVKVPALFEIESFSAVHHLVSTVEGKLKDPLQSVDLLKAAFPGGSITGAPKISAMRIIESLEPHQRSVYCGSIGYINQDGSSDTNIAIRTLVAADNSIHCWAGGGIVMDSEAAAEYQETFDKVKRILPVLTELNSISAHASESSSDD